MLVSMLRSLLKLSGFSVSVIYHGLQLSCGLYVLAYIFHFTAGRFGDLLTTVMCLQGALEAAPAVATGCIIVALICDLEIKYRNGGDAT